MRTELATLALLVVACGGPAPAASPPTATAKPSATASAIPVLTLKNVWATVPDVQKLGTPNGVALDGNENFYVGDITKYGVAEFDRAGSFVRRFDLPAGAQFPTGIAVDAGSSVYVAYGGSMVKFDPGGRVTRTWPTYDSVAGVAADGAGHVFAAAHRLHDHYVEKFDAEGKLLAEFGTTGRGDGQFFVDDTHPGPEQIATGRDGNVYVTDPAAFRVIEFDNSGAFVRNYVADPESAPRPLVGVAVDGAGNVYAAAGGPLIKWAPDGRIVAHLRLPGADSAWGASPAANSGGDLWLWELGPRNPSGGSTGIVHRLTAGS
jgi:sugar lactone lactonase YvrE